MTLLAVERIKLFSTRSPWWSAALTLLITVGFAGLVAGTAPQGSIGVATTQFGYTFGLAVVMVFAALAVTTEYRFGTIRTTFQAVPHRTSALLAKAGVVALTAFVLGEIAAFGSLAIASVLQPGADLALNSTADWTTVLAIGPVFALTAVIAMSVGVLVRHSAGAISLVLIYTLAVEQLVALIPNIGDDIQKWMPFQVANKFVMGGGAGRGDNMGGPPLSASPLSPGWALAYFAGFALVMLIIAVTTAKKRDA